MPGGGKKKPAAKKTLRSSTGKVVKNISDKKNSSILKSRTARKPGVGRRSVREGYSTSGSGRKTGRSQYVNKVKKVSKIKKTAGVKKASGPKAKVLKKKK